MIPASSLPGTSAANPLDMTAATVIVDAPSSSTSGSSSKRPATETEPTSSSASKKKRSSSTSRTSSEDRAMPDEFECFFLGRTQGLRPLYVDPSRASKLDGWQPSHCQIVYRTYGDEINGRVRPNGRTAGVYSAYETYCVIHDRRCPHVSVRGLVHVYDAAYSPPGGSGVDVREPGQSDSTAEADLKPPILIDISQDDGSSPRPIRRTIAVNPLPPVTAKAPPTSRVVAANERSAALLKASREQARAGTPPPQRDGYLNAPASPGYSPSV